MIEKWKLTLENGGKICCTGGVKLSILDGGGVGKFEVIKLLELLKK